MGGADGHAGGVRHHQADEADRPGVRDEDAGEQDASTKAAARKRPVSRPSTAGALLADEQQVQRAGQGDQEQGAGAEGERGQGEHVPAGAAESAERPVQDFVRYVFGAGRCAPGSGWSARTGRRRRRPRPTPGAPPVREPPRLGQSRTTRTRAASAPAKAAAGRATVMANPAPAPRTITATAPAEAPLETPEQEGVGERDCARGPGGWCR